MGILGQYFSDEDRNNYIVRQLIPGRVIYIFCPFTDPPKEKFLIIVYWGTKPLLFVVNSRVPEFIKRKPELSKCQVPITSLDYDFLDHDSFINCSEVYDSLESSEIINQIYLELGRIKGELSVTTKRQIIAVVRDAKTVSANHKRLIIDALGT